jgi:hypothetical protein
MGVVDILLAERSSTRLQRKYFGGHLLIIQRTTIVDTIDVARTGVPHSLHQFHGEEHKDMDIGASATTIR